MISEVEWAGNYYLTRAHAVRPGSEVGTRARSALCSVESNPVDVYDQAWHDEMVWRYSRKKAKEIERLPRCKKCLKRVAS